MADRRFVRTVLILSTVVFVSQSSIEAGTGPAPQLKVTAASFDAAAETLAIYGVNFGATRGVVTLNGFPLPVAEWTDTEIHALLSADTASGSYLLTVSRGPSTTQFDAFSVTLVSGVLRSATTGRRCLA